MRPAYVAIWDGRLVGSSTVRNVLTSGILFTDHYQLTMAQLYFRAGLQDRLARFEHSFRAYPDYGNHQAGYAISAGVGPFVDWMQGAVFDQEAADALRSLRTSKGAALFEDGFLDWMMSVGGFGEVSLWGRSRGSSSP